MTTRKPLPTQERLRELFDYHPDGYFIRRVSVGRRPDCQVGAEVRGSLAPKGRYREMMVDGVKGLKLHRLVYQWHHGWCPDELDHEDRDKGNNRIGNLKPTTHSGNVMNAGLRVTNTTGFRGVSPYKGRFRAQVRGLKPHLGYFDTPAEAAEAITAEEERV